MVKGSNSTTSSTSSTLPSYIQPYVTDLLSRAQAQSNQPYVPYTGQRVADTTAASNQAYNMIGGIAAAGVPGAITQAQQTAGGIAGYMPQQVGSDVTGYQSDQIGSGITAFQPQQVSTNNWTQANQQAYMDPYLSSVLANTNAQALQNFNEQQGVRNSAAIAAGAFGGSRATIADALAQRDLNQQLNTNNLQALSNAYNTGANLYQTDAARALQAQQANQTAGINAAQLQLAGQTANQNANLNAAQLRLSGQQANQTAGINAANLNLGAAQQLGSLGQMQNQIQLGNALALSGVGTAQQQQAQAGLDAAYQAFQQQQQYPAQQLSLYSQLLAGVPVTQQTTTTTTPPTPSLLSQLLGLGIAGIGAFA